MIDSLGMYYARSFKKMGVVTGFPNEGLVKLKCRNDSSKVILYLSESMSKELEKVKTVLVGKFLITDLQTMNDDVNDCYYVFEVGISDITVWKVDNKVEKSEESFFLNCTNPKKCVIIKTVKIVDFKKLKTQGFLQFLSELNDGTGTITVGENLREIK